MDQYICLNKKVPGEKPITGVGYKDSRYKAILGTVGRIKAQYGHGKFDNILGGMKEYSTLHERMERQTSMSITYVRSGAQGSKVLNGDDTTEKELYPRIEKLWEKRKRVSRSVIFSIVIDINLVLKVSGGPGIKGTVGHMKRMKKWL